MVQFEYGPSGERYRQFTKDGQHVIETLSGDAFEQVRESFDGSLTQQKPTQLRYYLGNGDEVFAVIEKNIESFRTTTNMWYLHKDQLGSVVRVTNKSGALARRYWYNPWGQQVDAPMLEPGKGFGAGRSLGFTGHEQLAVVGLIHMNGRVYDFETGMFLSADPVDLVTGYTQTLGRYSYVLNNPFKYTDPTGLRWSPRRAFKGAIIGFATGGIGGAIAGGIVGGNDRSYEIVKENWREAAIVTVAVGVTVATGGAGAIVAGMAAGAAAGATRAALYGGDASDIIEGSIKGGVIGGVSGAFSFGAEQAFSGVSGTLGGQLGEIGAQSVVGGAMTEVEGGNFWAGFASTAFTQASNTFIPQFSGVGLNVVRAAVVGGTVAEISGGKFANGAIFSAYSYTLNYALHSAAENNQVVENEDEVGERSPAMAAVRPSVGRAVKGLSKAGKYGYVKTRTVVRSNARQLLLTPKGKELFGVKGLGNKHRYNQHIRIGVGRYGGNAVFRISSPYIPINRHNGSGHINLINELGPFKGF